MIFEHDFTYKGKTVYTGYESSGKSLMFSHHLIRNVKRNSNWLKKFDIKRPIVTNLPISDDFVEYSKDQGVEIRSWYEVDELATFEGLDLYIDEIGCTFPKDMYEWKDIPLRVKRWLPQSEKLGVQLYATAQDYGQVAKDFRRLVKRLYEVKQAFGPRRPGCNLPYKPRFVVGCQVIHRLNARSFEGDQFDLKPVSKIPKIKWYNRAVVNRYDTSKLVLESPPAPLRKVVRTCPEDGHTIVRYI